MSVWCVNKTLLHYIDTTQSAITVASFDWTRSGNLAGNLNPHHPSPNDCALCCTFVQDKWNLCFTQIYWANPRNYLQISLKPNGSPCWVARLASSVWSQNAITVLINAFHCSLRNLGRGGTENQGPIGKKSQINAMLIHTPPNTLGSPCIQGNDSTDNLCW